MKKPSTPGEAMRASRAASKLTQADIAAEVEVTQPLIARWEADKASPPTHLVRKVARVYKLKPEQILPAEDA